MHGRISKVIFLTAITILVGSCRQDKIQLTGTCLKSSNSGAINWLYSSKHYLPWPSGLSYQITQTTGGATHNNLNPDNLKMLYAWDFGVTRVSGTKLPGDKVIAAINGTVAAIKRDSNIVGGGPEAKNDSNYVFINWDLEDSNEVRSGLLLQSQYWHFHSVSANLTVGKRVSRGTELGVAGCTGWCYGTHLHYEVRDRNTNHSLPIQFVERIPVALVGVVSKNSPPASAQVPDQRPPQTPPEAPIQDVPNTFAFQGLCDSRTTEKQSICLNELDSNQDVLKTMLVNCQEKTSTFCPNICIANSDSASNDFCGLATAFSRDPNGDTSTDPLNKHTDSNDANPANCD